MPLPDDLDNKLKTHYTPANPNMMLHANPNGPVRKAT